MYYLMFCLFCSGVGEKAPLGMGALGMTLEAQCPCGVLKRLLQAYIHLCCYGLYPGKVVLTGG